MWERAAQPDFVVLDFVGDDQLAMHLICAKVLSAGGLGCLAANWAGWYAKITKHFRKCLVI
jgi:hypothetical protein